MVALREAQLANVFRYSRLASSRSIRLLKLVPSANNRINCTLQEYSIDDAPPFDALSYTWGYPLTPYSNLNPVRGAVSGVQGSG
jgi:hypothetical protein